jgi:hypothetical protein
MANALSSGRVLGNGNPCGHILRKFASTLRSFAVLENAHASRWNIRWIQANNASIADFDEKAEPVGNSGPVQTSKRFPMS